MIQPYTKSVELQMQSFYERLKEKEQRHYAALESQKLGYGGKAYIMRLFRLHHKTLNKGIAELTDPELYATLPLTNQRRAGGGRKKNRGTTTQYPRAIICFNRPI